MKHSSLASLTLMAVLSFLAMYALMYAMVDSYDHVYNNLNQFYMAGLMTAAMLIIELLAMGSMYDKKIRLAVIGFGAAALILFFVGIRQQTGISDREFLKSMIPHHSSALLMCNQAKLADPEIRSLCQSIISSQQEQIDWMETKLSISK